MTDFFDYKATDEVATTDVAVVAEPAVEDHAVEAEVPDEVATVVPSLPLPAGVVLR